MTIMIHSEFKLCNLKTRFSSHFGISLIATGSVYAPPSNIWLRPRPFLAIISFLQWLNEIMGDPVFSVKLMLVYLDQSISMGRKGLCGNSLSCLIIGISICSFVFVLGGVLKVRLRKKTMMYLCKKNQILKSRFLNKYKNMLCKIKLYKLIIMKCLGDSLVSSVWK